MNDAHNSSLELTPLSKPDESYLRLDRIADIFLADNIRGYLIRFATEPLPLFIIWSLGDLLGFLTGWRDYRAGKTLKGNIKMLTAAIPGFPTIPAHIIIDKILMPTSAKNQSR